MPRPPLHLPAALAVALHLTILPWAAGAEGFPDLVPLETILPPPDTATTAPEPLAARAAALRLRAQALRDRRLIDDDTRRRMAEIAASLTRPDTP